MRSAIATAPIDTSILAQRLLTLRIEIDAILEQLARQSAIGSDERVALTEPTQVAIEPAGAATLATHAEAMARHADVTDTTPTSEPVGADLPEPADAVEIEPEPAPVVSVDTAGSQPAQVVSTTDAVSTHDEASLGDDAIELAAAEPEHSPEATAEQPGEARPQAEPAMVAPTRVAPADTMVVSLDAHRPSPKKDLEARSVAKHRPYRAKIAACILAGFVVAGLAFADLSALGSAPSEASPAPLTAPFTSAWTLPSLWQGGQRSHAPDAINAQASLPLIEGFPVSAEQRYRAAWPSGS
jgi:hypothetical protein